jgi:omega-amidase
LVWETPQANHTLLEKFFQAERTDLIVLPEMFSTGFTRNFAEQAPPPSLAWMKKLAAQEDAAVYGSIAWDESGEKFNRGTWVLPDGKYLKYDKKHLFSYGKEQEFFLPGDAVVQIPYSGWNIRPLICYDLRFPVWSRNVAPYYDILIYIASWPEARREAWISLLKARAIENQCYVIGVNRIGTDGYGLAYSGDSCIFDFSGKELLHAGSQVGRFDQTLDLQELQDFRLKYPFLNDADPFTLITR